MPKYRIKSDILGVDFGIQTDQKLTERDYFDILKTKVSPQKMLGVYRRNKDDEKVQSLATKALDNDFFDTGVGFATGFAEAGKSLGRGVKNMMVTNIYGTSRLLDASMQYGEPDESQRYDDLIEEGIKKAGQQLKGLSYASKRTDRTIEDDLSQALQFAGLSQEDENLKKRVIAEARRQDDAQTDATQAQAGVDALGMTTMLGAKLKQALGEAKDIVTGETSFGGDSQKRKLRELDYLVEQDYITRTMERGAELGLALTGQEESLRDVRSGLVEPDRDVALLGSIPLDPTLAPSILASGGMAFGRNLIARGAINKFGKQAAEESALRATIAQISDVANPTATQKALLKTAEKKLQAVGGSGKKLEQLVAKSEGIAKTKAIDLIQKGQGNSPFAARILQAIDKAPAPKATFTNRMTGKILEKAGISGEYLGRTIEFLQRLPEETLTTLFMRSGMDEQAAMSAARGTARTLQASAAAGVLTGGFSEFTPELENLGLALLLAPGGSSLLTRFGHDTAILGKQLQYAQSSLPLFQRIAQLDPADSSLTAVTLDRTSALTLPGTISGLAEGVFAKSRQFGPSPALKVPATALTRTGLGNTLTGAVNTAKTAIGATAIPGAIGYAIDGEAGAGGAIASSIPFIAAGLGLGTLARYGSKADIQAKMLGDESYYKDTYLNDADRVMYEGLKKPVRQALATSAIQNPDVIYKFIDKRGSSHWTVENGESVVTIYTKSAPQEQLSAVLGHEIAHHIDAFGFMPQILEQLVGSVEKGKPGIFTEFKNGKPVIIKDAEGRDVYATNKEFAKHRERYLDLLEKSGTDKKHPDYQAYANDDARIAREIFASHGAAWYFGGDFVTRNYQGAGAKMMGAILEPLFSSPGLRKFFHRIGLATQENTGLVADPLNLFPGLKEIPQLTRMIEKYNDDVRGFGPQARREGRGRGNLVDPAFADEIATVNLTAKDLENTAIVDRLKAGGVVKIKDDGTIETDAEGRPVFLPTREVNKKNKQLSNDILSIIRKKEDAGETFGEGHVALEKTADGRDRATGRFLDPSIIDELAQTGRYNPHQLAALKQISQTLRNDTGDVWNLFYYSALKYNKAGRKVYGQIKGGDRKSLPFGIEITKDGNINIQTISLEAFRKNLDWFAKSKGYEQKMAEAFQGMNAYENVQNAMKLLPTYLQNHMKGVINGSKGSGITPLQRDLINASIGRINADQVKANPILEGLGDRRSQRQQSIRSRRLDRIGNAIRGESGFPAFKSAIEQNKVPMYTPKPEADVQITDKLFMPAGDQKGYSIIERPAKHFGDGFQKFRITHDESNGFIEVVVKPNGTSSVTQLLVPESFRRQGIGRSLQEKAQELYPNLGGQVSSKYAAKSAYDLGRRPPDNPKASLEEVFNAIDQDSSVNLVSQNQDKLFMPASEAGAGKGKLAKAAKLWQEKGEDSPFFKKWFGKSKVVDENGKPLVVKHGLASGELVDNFFDPDKLGRNTKAPSAMEGFFFSRGKTSESYGLKTLDYDSAKDLDYNVYSELLNTREIFESLTGESFDDKIPGTFSSFDEGVLDPSSYFETGLSSNSPEDYVVDLQSKLRNTINDLEWESGSFQDDIKNQLEQEADRLRKNVLEPLEEVDDMAAANVAQVEAYLSLQDPLIVDQKGKEYRETTYYDTIAQAKRDGRDGVIIKNTYDGGPLDDIYIAFKPEQIKSATGNRGTFDAGERNILFMPSKGTSALDILKSNQKPEGLPKVPTILEIAEYFKKEFGNPIDYKKSNPEQNRLFEDLIYEEVLYAQELHPEAAGWYDENLSLALSVLEELDPTIKQPDNNFIFKSVLAATSDGNKVQPQFDQTWATYNHWKDTGEISGKFVGGDRISNIKNNLLRIEAIFQLMGGEGAGRWLSQKGTIGEIRKAAQDDLGYTKAEASKIGTSELVDEVVPYAVILGPKLGSFFNNLYGDYSTFTMDRWFMRTVGRNTGTQVVPIPPAKLNAAKQRVRDAVNSLTPAERKKIGITKQSVAGNNAIKASTKLAGYFTKKQNRTGVSAEVDNLRRAANALNKFGKPLKEAPQNGAERRWLRERLETVQSRLRDVGVNLENADLQALLWYNEKEIYEKLGYRSPTGSADYAGAAEALHARKAGKPSRSYADGTGRVGEIGRSTSEPVLGKTSPQEVNFLPAGNFSRQPANRITRQAPAMPGNRFMLPAATAGAKSAERFR